MLGYQYIPLGYNLVDAAIFNLRTMDLNHIIIKTSLSEGNKRAIMVVIVSLCNFFIGLTGMRTFCFTYARFFIFIHGLARILSYAMSPLEFLAKL